MPAASCIHVCGVLGVGIGTARDSSFFPAASSSFSCASSALVASSIAVLDVVVVAVVVVRRVRCALNPL